MSDTLFDVPGGTLGMAKLSDDGRYRYTLHRRWDITKPRAVFVMLNPSTADADTDDATIRRCIGFASSWGMGGIAVVNVYAYRATRPADLWHVDDPVGYDNDAEIAVQARTTGGGPVVAAWGANAKPDRVREVVMVSGTLFIQCLGTTKSGAPRHPLYVRADTPLTTWVSPDSKTDPCPAGCGRMRALTLPTCGQCWSSLPNYVTRAAVAAWRRWRDTRDNDDLAAYLVARDAAIASIG